MPILSGGRHLIIALAVSVIINPTLLWTDENNDYIGYLHNHATDSIG
jgi:energy-coupling factor transporter ATP-binding protein EcfA2